MTFCRYDGTVECFARDREYSKLKFNNVSEYLITLIHEGNIYT